MSDIEELIALPGDARQPYLHPTDVPQARALFLRGWWFARLGSLPVAVLLGACVWLITGSVVAALLSPVATYAIGTAAGRWLQRRSWDYIPRKRWAPRSSRHGSLPAAVVDSVALILAAAALTMSVRVHHLSLAVFAFAVGAVAAIAVLQIIEVAVASKRSDRESPAPQRLIRLTAIIASGLIGASLLLDAMQAERGDLLVTALAGATTVFVAQLIWSLIERYGHRREHKEALAPGQHCTDRVQSLS